MAPSPHEVTGLLEAWSHGDKAALDKLTPLVYDELRRLAHHYMSRERAGHTLQTTALVNEAYVRLVDQKDVQWQNRAHFFAVAAQVMRHILIDHARTCTRAKRGGEARSQNNSGGFNAFFGESAGSANTTGNVNSFFGNSAGSNNTEGESNSFFGQLAGSGNTLGSRQVVLWSRASR